LRRSIHRVACGLRCESAASRIVIETKVSGRESEKKRE
jgi:hypothetical protein